MNKQLILLATLVATQASMNAFDADAMKTLTTMQAISECANATKSWVPDAIKNAASATHDYVTETVVPATAHVFKNLNENCPTVEGLIAQVKPASSRFEVFKNGVFNLKDKAVAYMCSFNRPTMPSWETTKNVANDLKNSTSAAIKQACESIKENAPLYFESAKNYATENPNKVAAVTVGSIAALVVMYKTVKYLRNSDEALRDYDAVVEPVKHAFRR